MTGVKGPRGYGEEPDRDPSLRVNSKEPFNAEPHRSVLGSSYVTPVQFFYKRNHGPIPIVDDIRSYSVSISGLVETPIQLSMEEIRNLPKHNVTATLQAYLAQSSSWFSAPVVLSLQGDGAAQGYQWSLLPPTLPPLQALNCGGPFPNDISCECAGNRRTSMSLTRTVKGVGWDVAAIGNAVWGGARLADVLELVGILKMTRVSELGGRNVEFVSVDMCKEENGGPYKASIPLAQGTNPEADVLLAYEMNGKILNRDHGYPLRVVVPGVIGARSVKWLDAINILKEECQGFFMQKDYKMFPPSVNWDNINWMSRRPQMDFPVQCAICSLEDINQIRPGKVSVCGYAVSGGGRGIERVDVSADGGVTWVEATRHQTDGSKYVADDPNIDKWAWVLFKATVDASHSTVITAKAVDSAGNVQPEKVEDIWNLRGILNTSWHKVIVKIDNCCNN